MKTVNWLHFDKYHDLKLHIKIVAISVFVWLQENFTLMMAHIKYALLFQHNNHEIENTYK